MRLSFRAPTNRRRSIVRAIIAAAVVAAITVPLALASTLPIRTARVSTTPDGASANGASADVVLSTTGRVMAFDTTATNLVDSDPNGPIRDVMTLDLVTNARRLISTNGNGPSYAPTVSGNGQRVVFASDATNLVPGDTNATTDLFLRDGGGTIFRVSVSGSGQQANGPSYQPELSADGNLLVFTSDASNLVANDTNGLPDVFVKDLRTGAVTRVSTSKSGAQANGRSLQPAISANGKFVTFASAASNLVSGDKNGISDVFVRDLATRTMALATVDSRGVQQNHAVAAPFAQVSDISKDGRYVVFDSDATNLYANDINSHTDVFLHDFTTGITTLVSASSFNVEGNNDSFSPRITPSGRYVSFQSFATNLAPGDGPREDIFLRDVTQNVTTIVNVTADGSPRGPELVPQLLQRPVVSDDGQTAAFSSTVANLTPGDDNGAEDIFVRLMAPPVAQIINGPRTSGGRVRLTVSADDPLAHDFVCQIDKRKPFLCGPDINVRHNSGRDLRIRAGGLGTLFSTPLRVSLSNDRKGPTVSIHKPAGSSVRVISGSAKDSSGVQAVQVAVIYYVKGTTCRYLATPQKFKTIPCGLYRNSTYLVAAGARHWRLRLPHSIHGPLFVLARGVDKIGNTGTTKTLSTTVG